MIHLFSNFYVIFGKGIKGKLKSKIFRLLQEGNAPIEVLKSRYDIGHSFLFASEKEKFCEERRRFLPVCKNIICVASF